ncbi:MAG: hypothetical protein KF861_08935 [Planctomycetaceae bacterium]|nr:hypothetical protein [Planctomycetaceae bacterium]
MHRLLSVAIATLTLFIAALAVLLAPSTDAEELRAGGGLRWYRGNMHTHSHWSDGDDYLESIADWYQQAGYQFLVFTDHNVLPNTERWVIVDRTKGKRRAYDKLKARFPDWVEERGEGEELEVRLRTFQEVAERFNRPEEYLLIQGEEISDSYNRYPIHINASNVEEAIPPMKGNSVQETIQNNVDAVIAQRERTGRPMIPHLNHPNFGYAVRAEDLMPIRGEKFFEVYNGHPSVHNHGDHVHASTERIWDLVLAFRLGELGLPVMYGLATDDGHDYHDHGPKEASPGRGWVQVLASELSPAALIEALEAGRFYASSGVNLKSVVSSPRGLAVEVDPVPGESYTIEFIGTKKDFDRASTPPVDDKGEPVHTTGHYSSDIGQVFATVRDTRATYTFRGDELYVRARITSDAKHPDPSEPDDFKQAWCQPVVGTAAIVSE